MKYVMVKLVIQGTRLSLQSSLGAICEDKGNTPLYAIAQDHAHMVLVTCMGHREQ